MNSDPDSETPADSDADLARLRHDLKNHLTALRSGCALLARYLATGEMDKVQVYLSEMQAEVERGFETVARMSSGYE